MAIGAVAGMMLRPWGAVIVGIVSALVSVLGYKYLVVRVFYYLYSILIDEKRWLKRSFLEQTFLIGKISTNFWFQLN